MMEVTLGGQGHKKPTPAAGLDELSRSISDIGSRLRVIEERYLNLRKKTQMTDQNLIDTEKSHVSEIRELNNKILDLQQGIADINEKMTVMLGELMNCVRQEDFTVLKKYIELWQPARFVTEREVAEMLAKDKTFIKQPR